MTLRASALGLRQIPFAAADKLAAGAPLSASGGQAQSSEDKPSAADWQALARLHALSMALMQRPLP